MAISEAEVVSLIDLSDNLPPPSDCEVLRDDFLETIDELFGGEHSVVCVEGPEGMGKTTLLAQFCRRHPDHAISLFLSPASRWSYDPEYAKTQLNDQLRFALRLPPNPGGEVNPNEFRSLLSRLHRLSRKRNERFYFVVDGLEHFTGDKDVVRRMLIDLIPFGMRRFRFLLSGCLRIVAPEQEGHLYCKELRLTRFSTDQSIAYLSSVCGDRSLCRDLARSCMNIPGRLASIKRSLQHGETVDEMLEKLSDSHGDGLAEVFRIEWDQVDTTDDLLAKALALMAYDNWKHDLSSLSAHLGSDPETLRDKLSRLGFLVVFPPDGVVEYVSDAFRRFAATQLAELKDDVLDLRIEALMAEPVSSQAVQLLPSYLKERGRYDQLIEYLGQDQVTRMVRLCESTGPAQLQLQYGISAAIQTKSTPEALGLICTHSVLEELSGAVAMQAPELEARLRLGFVDDALALAQSAPLKLHRLRLLSAVARMQWAKGVPLEPELVDLIRSLCAETAHEVRGRDAASIASDLAGPMPDLAMGMLDSLDSCDGRSRTADFDFVRLSLMAASASCEEVAEGFASKISDPAIREVAGSLRILLMGKSAEEVIAEVSRLNSYEHQLFVLRHWAFVNRHGEDAIKVSEWAIQNVLGRPEFTPSVSHYCDIAAPLVFTKERSTALRLVNLIDAQLPTIVSYGASEDSVRLNLLLARTEWRLGIGQALERLIDLYLHIIDMSDLHGKSVCLARFVAALAAMDPDRRLEEKESLHSLSEAELRQSVRGLLDSTADHFGVSKGIVRSLARYRPDLVVELLPKVNTDRRRDEILAELVDAACNTTAARMDLGTICHALDQIGDTEIRDRSVHRVVELLAAQDLSDSGLVYNDLAEILDRTVAIADPVCRSLAVCAAHLVAVKLRCDRNPHAQEDARDFREELSAAWHGVDRIWERIQMGFRISSQLADYDPDLAKDYLAQSDSLRERHASDSVSALQAYLMLLRLAIRAFIGLVACRAETERAFERLSDLVDVIPSCKDRIGIWSELATWLRSVNDEQRCRDIVDNHIRPMLSALQANRETHELFYDCVVEASTAVYSAHRLVCFDLVDQLPPSLQDRAYFRISEFVLTNVPFSEPFEIVHGNEYDVDYAGALELCEIMKRVHDDCLLYCIAEATVSALLRGRSCRKVTRQEKAKLGTQISSIAATALPMKGGIQHEGYRIAVEAHALRLRTTKWPDWESLIRRAEGIPNVSDRALVLTIIAGSVQDQYAAKADKLIEGAIGLVAEIPCVFDRADRYASVADALSGFSGSVRLCKDCLEKALVESAKLDDPSSDQLRQRIIDMAYRIDPDHAETLVSLVDDDPARVELRTRIQQRLTTLRLTSRAATSFEDPQAFGDDAVDRLPDAAWKMLGSLNSRRSIPVRLSEMEPILTLSRSLPLSRLYPIMAWATQNAIARLANSREATQVISRLFGSFADATDLCMSFYARTAERRHQTGHSLTVVSERDGRVIRPWSREEALSYIRCWVEQNAAHYIKIHDPYFDPTCLEYLQIIASVKPDCRVQICTSLRHQERWCRQGGSISSVYSSYWRTNVSDQAPPDTEIVVCGRLTDGISPIHDRWWVTENAGLRIGTSLNSLGEARISEISQISCSQVTEIEEQINGLLERRTRECGGDRVVYESFTLL